MQPYWIDLEGGGLGVGITARSDDDALAIFESAFGSRDRIVGLRVIKDLNELDQGHVRPNMAKNWFVRGIWFPQGHEDSN